MKYTEAAIVTTSLLVVVLVLLWILWWRRRRKDHSAYALPEPPDDRVGDPVASFEGIHYVATTPTGRALERLTVGQLGFRGRCAIEIRRSGVIVSIKGEQPFQIRSESIEAVDAGTVAIDRVVERGGLTVIRWCLANEETSATVETAFRVVDPVARHELKRMLRSLISSPSHPADEETL